MKGEAWPDWVASPFTGIFKGFGPIAPQAHDPGVHVWGAVMAPFGERKESTNVGGAGWSEDQARMACIGEALERCQTQPLPQDACRIASYAEWRGDEPASPPDAWILFHPTQYELDDFPFEPFTEDSVCRWICFRSVPTGEPIWVPEQLAFLYPRAGDEHSIAPATSTGLSCGRVQDPVLLRGVQEVIERDGIMGAWWDSYPLEAWEGDEVWTLLGVEVRRKLQRPNLKYRFYRVDSPFSAHLTIVTLQGHDRWGECFSCGGGVS